MQTDARGHPAWQFASSMRFRLPHSLPYKRHRPEQTHLYQIVERHYPKFWDVMAAQKHKMNNRNTSAY
jgi:hypothetical protein